MAAGDHERDPPKGESEEEEDLWSAILGDVADSSSRNRKQVTKTLLVLGDVSSGKSILIDRLCELSQSEPMGGRFPLSGCSLEYRFVDVQDKETDDLLDRMGVWILDGVVWHCQLLPFVLTQDTIHHTTVMIVVDLSQPWGIMESLERWAQVVRKHINSLQVPNRELKEMEEKMVKQFQSYIDPEEARSVPVSTVEGEGVALPLGETTLTCNLGVPIVVVCCKSDAITSQLEKVHNYRDEELDFLQQAIRKFALHYGAALFYVSTKEDRNVSLLHKYLLHRGYSLPFKESACVVDKDAIFIPSGWDSEKKISIFCEHVKRYDHDELFENVIKRPAVSQAESEVSRVSAEDDQVFLMAQQAHLVRSPKPISGSSASGPSPAKSSPVSRPSPSLVKSPGGAESGEGGKPAGETVLANFFNSLLSKKQAGSKGGGSSRSATARSEANSELERLQSKKPAPKP